MAVDLIMTKDQQAKMMGVSMLIGIFVAMGLVLIFDGGVWEQPLGTFLIALSVTFIMVGLMRIHYTVSAILEVLE